MRFVCQLLRVYQVYIKVETSLSDGSTWSSLFSLGKPWCLYHWVLNNELLKEFLLRCYVENGLGTKDAFCIQDQTEAKMQDQT